MKLNKLLTAAFLIFILPVTSAHAADQVLRVSPVIIDLTLTPGKTIYKEIQIDNLLPAPLPVQASIESFRATDEERAIALDSSTSSSPLVTWISIDPDDMIIDAKSSKKVLLAIEVPTQVEVGGYYAMVFLSPVVPVTQLANQQVIPRVGIVILATLGVPDNRPAKDRISIESFTFSKLVYDVSEIPGLKLRVGNTSLSHVSAKPILTFTPLMGKTTVTDLPEKTILPNRIRKWEQTLNRPEIPPNIYRIKLDVTIGGGNSVSTGKTIIVMPYIRTLPITGLVVLFTLFVLLRKRIARAVRILIRGKG